jgi:hypothetical protein
MSLKVLTHNKINRLLVCASQIGDYEEYYYLFGCCAV